MKTQKYIYSAWADGVLIMAPPFLCLALVWGFASYFEQPQEVGAISWLILVLMVDVSHVYSTLYRTYLDPEMQKGHKVLLYGIPAAVWIGGMLLYTLDDMAFWRVIAYLALFHFVRQQYGFFRIYERHESLSMWRRRSAHLMIYAASLYPVSVWHLSGSKNFSWFVPEDFLLSSHIELVPYVSALYALIWAVYVYFEVGAAIKDKFINIPKNVVLLGTALSWYFGIVYFNSDLIFTLLNVVSHGIPYMALVWMHGNKRLAGPQSLSSVQLWVYSIKGIFLFVFILLLLAFVEESLWDTLIWHDHPEFFGFNSLWGMELSQGLKVLVVPLLAVPQLTHYVLDGFIWKVKTPKAALSAL